jgi:hypothetical protein
VVVVEIECVLVGEEVVVVEVAGAVLLQCRLSMVCRSLQGVVPHCDHGGARWVAPTE